MTKIAPHALRQSLTRLAFHLRAQEWALTGSVAIDLWRREAGNLAACDAIGDVDIVARTLDAVGREIARDFLISHYHVPQPEHPKFMVQLVDPGTRLRIDVFPDLVGAIALAQERIVAGVPVRILPADCILDHKLLILSGASDARRVDRKHYRGAISLAAILGRSVPHLPAEFQSDSVYSAKVGAPCERCQASLDSWFPLAPRKRIVELLGYV